MFVLEEPFRAEKDLNLEINEYIRNFGNKFNR